MFYTNRSRQNGYSANCRDCHREYYLKNRVAIIAYNSQRKRIRKAAARAVREQEEKLRTTKVCTKCRQELLFEKFVRNRHIKSGYDSKCKNCRSNYAREKGFSKKYYEKNREELLVVNKIYRTEYREILSAKANERRKENIQLKLTDNLRRRLRSAIQRGFKGGSAVRDLGCTVVEFKRYLESKFKPGMTWGNYGHGLDKWTIDHIMPMKAFDLTNRQHVLLACHWGNMQPLWFSENMSKSDNIG